MANYKKSIAMVNYNRIQEDINNMKLGTMKWLGNNIELNDMQGVHTTFLLSLEEEGGVDMIAVGHESYTGHR
jgi:hypothetical protein